MVYYKLLKPSETITGYRYRTQLMRLSRALKEKRPQYQKRHDKVILQHGSARPHVARPVKTYLETSKWEVLPHPPYSPDVAPSDHYLFRSMAHGLAHQHFRSYKEVKKWINSFCRKIIKDDFYLMPNHEPCLEFRRGKINNQRIKVHIKNVTHAKNMINRRIFFN